MKKYLKIVLFGFITWLVPFAASFLFYMKDGKLNIDIFLFKSIMIVTGVVTVAFLLVIYFKKIEKNYLKEGIILGIIWFCINILLDLLILVTMSGMTFTQYFTQIGLSYLVIPVMCILSGKLIENKK